MILNLFHTISVYSIGLAFLAGILFFRRLKISERIVIGLLFFGSISQFAPVFFKSKSQIWLFYNLYILLDAGLWAAFFYIDQKDKRIKKIILAVLLLHYGVSIFLFFKNGITGRFHSELVCFDSLAQVIWVLLFFYSKYKFEVVEKLETQPGFWFSLAIFIYCPCTYFLFANYEQIKLSAGKYLYLWSLHDLVNFITYILYIIGFFSARNRHRYITL